MWEKKFEVYCIENDIPIWTPVINQSHEDYLVKMLHEIVPVNVKYRKINTRGRFELKLTSRKNNWMIMIWASPGWWCGGVKTLTIR